MDENSKMANPLEKTQSVGNMPELAEKKQPTLRKNYSFDESWLSSFGGQNRTAEMMDFVDDSDSWSQASYDSNCTTSTDGIISTGIGNSKSYRTFSISNFAKRRSSLKDLNELSKLGESMNLKDVDKSVAQASPQSTPGCVRRGSLTDVNVDTKKFSSQKVATNDLEEKAKRGLSHSMILNWLYFKKYPTITESEGGETPKIGSPIDGSAADMALQMGPVASPEALQEALKGIEKAERKSLSFRDINAISPSYW
jgi:hypothetical protein